MALWDKAWPGGSIRLGLALGAAPLDGAARVPVEFMPLEILAPPILRTGDFDAPPEVENFADTTDGSITGRLPSDPSEGDRFHFSDYVGSWGIHSFLIDPSGNEFEDLGDGGVPTEPMICDLPAVIYIIFSGGKYRLR